MLFRSAALLRSGQRIQIRMFLERAGWAALGALLATLALCLINWEVGRPFLFFGALLDAVVRFVGNPENVQEFHKPSGWVWTARYLAFPAAVAVAGIAFILASFRQPARTEARLAQALVLQFLAMALLWVAWQAAGQSARAAYAQAAERVMDAVRDLERPAPGAGREDRKSNV